MASEIGKIVHCKICGAPIEARGNRLYCPVCYNPNRRNAAQRSNARTKMEREQTKREEAKMKENNRIATSAAELNMRAKLSNLGGISYDTQMNAPADMPAQDIPAPLAQDPAAEQNASDKKQMFHKGKGKDKKNAHADKKRGKAKSAPAEVQGEGLDGNMPVEKPKKKSKAGVIVAVVLAAVIGGGALGYAYVPAVYDGVNNVLTAVTGKQVGVPAPIPSNTGDGNAPTVSQPQLQQSSGTSENALNGIDLSGDVTIEFYATVRTADGREYKVPLSSANLTDGNLKSLLDGSGFTLTSGQ